MEKKKEEEEINNGKKRRRKNRFQKWRIKISRKNNKIK